MAPQRARKAGQIGSCSFKPSTNTAMASSAKKTPLPSASFHRNSWLAMLEATLALATIIRERKEFRKGNPAQKLILCLYFWGWISACSRQNRK